jgi:hypothetical protein
MAFGFFLSAVVLALDFGGSKLAAGECVSVFFGYGLLFCNGRRSISHKNHRL